MRGEFEAKTAVALALLSVLSITGSSASLASAALPSQPPPQQGEVEVVVAGIVARSPLSAVSVFIELGNSNYSRSLGDLKAGDAITTSHSFTVTAMTEAGRTPWAVTISSPGSGKTARLMQAQGELDMVAKTMAVTGSYFDDVALHLTSAQVIQFGLLQVTGVISVRALTAGNATGAYAGSISAGDNLSSITPVQGSIQGGQVAFNSTELTSTLPSMRFSVVVNVASPGQNKLLFEVNGTFHFAVNGTLSVSSPIDKIAAEVESVRYTFIQQRTGYLFSVPAEYIQRAPLSSAAPSAGSQVLWYAIGRGTNSSLVPITSGQIAPSNNTTKTTAGSTSRLQSTESSAPGNGTERNDGPLAAVNLPVLAALAAVSVAAIAGATYVRRRRGKA